jgi:hypothetical protein
MNIPCPNVIDCPGTDNPFANLSSEAPDFQYYKRVAFFGGLGPDQAPPIGVTYSKLACAKVFDSTISQVDADEQASNAAKLCVYETWTDPNGNHVGVFFNAQQSCGAKCPDGNTFTYTVGAGRFTGLTQAAANQSAYSAACQLAQQHKLCLSSLPEAICYDVSATLTIYASATLNGGTLLWELVSGQVPDGMTFNGGVLASTQVTITGTPDLVGTYNFSVRCTAQNGDHMTKAYTLIVAGITNSLPLADASEGTDYGPLQLNEIGFTGPVFTISAGALPSGMAMDSDGIISGTPSGTGDYNFTVRITETIGGPFACDTPLVLTVASGLAPYVYYNLDSNHNDNVAKVDGGNNPYSLDLSVYGNPAVTYVAGKIGTALRKTAFQTLYNEDNPITYTWRLTIDPALTDAYGFSIRFWVKYTSVSSIDLIVGQGPTSTTFPSYRIDVIAGTVNFYITTDFIGLGEVFIVSVPGSGVQDGNWHMIVARYQVALPQNKMFLQVDNGAVQETDIDVGKGVVWDAIPGFSIFSPGGGTNVLIDEVAIYKGYVLTDSDITNEWQSGNGRTWDGTGWVNGP